MSATKQDGTEASRILFAPIADKPCGLTPDGTWLREKRELFRNAAGQLCERPL